jgi:hypothetical protein
MNQLSKRLIGVAIGHLGPMADVIIEEIVEKSLNKNPDTITKEDIPKIAIRLKKIVSERISDTDGNKIEQEIKENIIEFN